MAIRKKFINVEIPSVNETVPILGTVEDLDRKTIKLDLSRKLKGRGIEAVFLIINKENKLVAYPKSLTLTRSHIQRAMRKRISYVEDSVPISCTDISGKIKPFLITRKKISRAIKNNLRKTAREFLIEYVKDKTYLEVTQEIVFGNLQKEMYPRLKKIYPLSLCEIRVIETKQIDRADLTVKIKEEKAKEEEVEEKTQAEEVEEELKKRKTKSKEKTDKKSGE